MLSANLRTQKLAVYCGIAWAVLFFVALMMAGQFPPPPPTLSGSEVLANVHENIFIAKTAIPLGILAAGLSIPFNALIAGHIARIETRDDSMPLLAISSFGGGLVNTVFFFMVFLPWGGMFYREDASPAAAGMINDIVWLLIVMAYSAPALQMICIALAGFRDRTANPVFPRWYCFLMLWIATGTCTGCLAIFFFSGPFAWNGLVGFWIPASAFCVWFVSLSILFLKYISQQAQQTPAESPAH